MFSIDENLRYGHTAGFCDHFLLEFFAICNINLLELNAFFGKELFCANAVGAIVLGIDDDCWHFWHGGSAFLSYKYFFLIKHQNPYKAVLLLDLYV